MKELTEAQKENRRAWQRAWHVKNREKRNASCRARASKHQVELATKQRAYYKTHAQHYRDYVNKANQEYRLKALQHYGGMVPKCACCGETALPFLTIDHVNLNGAAHRKELVKGKATRGGNKLYRWLAAHKYPVGFQVLCWNCNCGSFKYAGSCPHYPGKLPPKKISDNPQIRYGIRKYYEKKLRVFTHYSMGTPKCACCGESIMEFLTLDHMQHDGAAHRKEISGQHAGGAKVYNWIEKHKYPAGFQVLCYNCNCGQELAKGVCPHKL